MIRVLGEDFCNIDIFEAKVIRDRVSFINEITKYLCLACPLRFVKKFETNINLVNVCDRFTSDVKLKSISVVGGADGTSPSKMRA